LNLVKAFTVILDSANFTVEGFVKQEDVAVKNIDELQSLTNTDDLSTQVQHGLPHTYLTW